MAAQNSQPLQNPWKNLDNYLEVQEKLGEGAFGEVWKVRHTLENQDCAVKQVNLDTALRKLGESDFSVLKLLREVQNWCAICSDNVVRYKSSWLENENGICQAAALKFKTASGTSNCILIPRTNFLFIQMEYCGGGSLKDWIKSSDRDSTTEDQLQNMCIQIAKGVDKIHQHNIIHRDLKPENILSDGKGTWKIADFGLSTKPINVAGSFRGTPCYQSPEICNRSTYSEKTDIYSLGLVYLEMFHKFSNSEKNDLFFNLQQDKTFNFSIIKRLLINRPTPIEAATVIKMLSRIPVIRPTASDVLQLFNGPTYRISYGLDSHYTRKFFGRQKELSELEQFFQRRSDRLCLVTGLTGIGKTELVKQFLKRQAQTNYAWLNGRTVEELKKSIMGLSKRVKVDLTPQHSLKMFNEIIIQSLKEEAKLPWIFVIDNLDEENVQVSKILNLLRLHERIFVIVTSVVRDILGEDAVFIEVDELVPIDAHTLLADLLNKLISPACETDIRLLCDALQNHPLALHQAAAYIIAQQRNSIYGRNYSVENYLDELGSEQSTVLEYSRKSQCEESWKTVMATLQLSIKRILKKYSSEGQNAITCLNIISFLSPNGIHVQFLCELFSDYTSVSSNTRIAFTSIHQLSDRTCQKTEESQDLVKSIELLKKYSLIKVENCLISVHSLVQQVTRTLFDKKLEMLESLCKAVEFNQLKEENLFPVLSLWQHCSENVTSIMSLKTFASKMMEKMISFSYYSEAMEFGSKAVIKLETALGETHPEVILLKQKYNLAQELNESYIKSLQFYHNDMVSRALLLGEEDSDFFSNGENLASLPPVDESLLSSTIQTMKFNLRVVMKGTDSDTRDSIIIKYSLATVLRKHSNYSEAIEYYRDILRWQENNLGNHHMAFHLTSYYIALCLFFQTDYSKAETDLLRISLLLSNNTFKPIFKHVLRAKYYLGLIYSQQKKTQRAAEILQETLQLQKLHLGVDSPDTKMTSDKLGELLCQKNREATQTSLTRESLTEQPGPSRYFHK